TVTHIPDVAGSSRDGPFWKADHGQFFSSGTRDQFGADLLRCGFGANARRRGGLGWVGLGVGVGGVLVFVGHFWAGWSRLARCRVDGDGGRGRPVYGVPERGGGPRAGGGRAGADGGERVRGDAGGDGAADRGASQPQ